MIITNSSFATDSKYKHYNITLNIFICSGDICRVACNFEVVRNWTKFCMFLAPKFFWGKSPKIMDQD